MAEAKPNGALHERKRLLRREAARVRASIPPRERAERAIDVERQLFDLPEIAAARSVLAFHSFGSEVPTAGVIARLLAEGKRVLLPVVDGKLMDAAVYREGSSMEASSYGALEPADRTPADPAAIDLVIAPGLAFDRTGNRLGYGGGFFDAYLHRVRPHCAVVAICFREQLVEGVPAGPRDVLVDVVITDREVIRTRGRHL